MVIAGRSSSFAPTAVSAILRRASEAGAAVDLALPAELKAFALTRQAKPRYVGIQESAYRALAVSRGGVVPMYETMDRTPKSPGRRKRSFTYSAAPSRPVVHDNVAVLKRTLHRAGFRWAERSLAVLEDAEAVHHSTIGRSIPSARQTRRRCSLRTKRLNSSSSTRFPACRIHAAQITPHEGQAGNSARGPLRT